MICHGVVDERRLGYNFCFLYSGIRLCIYSIYTEDPGLAIVTWGKPAVRWVKSTSKVTQPSPIGS
jgi:hypothetical protein